MRDRNLQTLSAPMTIARNEHTVKTAGGSRRRLGDDSHFQSVFAAPELLIGSIHSDDVFGSNSAARQKTTIAVRCRALTTR